MRVMNLLREAGYLKIALVGLETVGAEAAGTARDCDARTAFRRTTFYCTGIAGSRAMNALPPEHPR